MAKSSLWPNGVLSSVVVPFDENLVPDADKLIRHCRWLLENDVGLALFGSNSEASSLSLSERKMLLARIVYAGLPPTHMMPSTGCCNIPETVELTHHAVNLGAAAVLVGPPSEYSGVSAEGLFDYYSRIIEGVADNRLRIYLHHIPPFSQLPITFGLIERLLKAYPTTIMGAKDSSVVWDDGTAIINAFALENFEVFSASETGLLRTMRAGGVGCISDTANVNCNAIVYLANNWQKDDAEVEQAALARVRGIFQIYPMIPALKSVLARYSGDPAWVTVRPPLTQLTEDQGAVLFCDLDACGFNMPRLQESYQQNYNVLSPKNLASLLSWP